LDLPFRQSVAHLKQELALSTSPAELLEQAVTFFQFQLHRHSEAMEYLASRGLQDPAIIEDLRIGYAPGGTLRRHLLARGYSLDALLHMGLINGQGRDAFCRRVIFPCCTQGQMVNLYGRAIEAAFPHRLLARSKGGLFAWETVRHFSTVILVEGLFDLAVLWQVGFRNTTCALGTHLTPTQFQQLCDRPARLVYIVFDQDETKLAKALPTSLRNTHNASAWAPISSTCRSGMIPTTTSLPAPPPRTSPPVWSKHIRYEMFFIGVSFRACQCLPLSLAR
jgi:DNA primase